MKIKKSGFSLIELSMVITVIAILIGAAYVGVTGTGGSNMFNNSKLTAARAMTASSPVWDIPDLALWLETTSASSFAASDLTSTTKAITTWYDLNKQLTTSNNATQNSLTSSRPLYVLNAINGLPALRFDGVDDWMDFNGTILANTNYTVFVVEQRRSSASSQWPVGAPETSLNNRFSLGYSANTTALFSQYLNNVTITVPAYDHPKPTILTATQNSVNGKVFYYSSTGSILNSSIADTVALITNNNATIGLRHQPAGGGTWYSGGFAGCEFYNGDIGEIIMFTRTLNDFERQAVEQYLNDKWKVY